MLTSDRLVLLETSVWVRYLRSCPNPDLVEWIRTRLAARRIATSGIIILEILQSSRNQQEFNEVQAMLEALERLPLTEYVCRSAAENGFALRRNGLIVPTTDLLIATVAQYHGAVLAHADRHYEPMAPHLGLQTVSFL